VDVLLDDDGKGFSADVVKLFEHVRKARPTTVKGGFGLVIAHRALQRSGGTMRLESTPDGGGRVRLTMRRATTAENAAPAPPPAAQPRAAT
jgi:signal transduction histidine kinase